MISVLYVDDEPALLELTRLFLERSGDIKVTAEQSVLSALERLKQIPFDVIVSDYLMPQMNGLDFLKAISPDYPHLSFILFTGKGKEEIAKEAINNGATFYLQKGNDPRSQYNELIQKIHAAFEKKKLQQENELHNKKINSEYQKLLILGENLKQTIEKLEINKQELLDEKHLLKTIINTAPFGVLICQPDQDNNLIIKNYNESASHILSFSLENHLENDIRKVFPPMAKDEIYDRFLAISRMGGRFDTEELLCNSNENKVFFELHAHQIKQNRVLIFFRDITNQINAENALIQSEEKYKVLVNTSQDGVFIVQHGNIIFANPAFAKMIGYRVQEITGYSFINLVIPGEREGILSLFLTQFNGKGLIKAYECKFLHKNGEHIIVQMNAGVIAYQGISSITGSIRDVTEIKKSEEALQTSEDNYKRIIENITDVFYQTDNEGIIKIVSPSAKDLIHSLNNHSIVGTPITSYWYQPEKRSEMLAVMQETGYIQDYEVTLLGLDGTLIPVSVSASFYYDENGIIAGVEGIIRDISERKRSESALRLVNTKLTLLSSITRHDILNKLTVILGYLDELKDNSDKSEVLSIIDKLEDHAHAILLQVEYTRLYQNLGVNSPLWQNFSDLLSHILPQIDLDEVKIESSSTDIEIYADPLFERAIYNIIENAIRHGGHISTIQICTKIVGPELHILIKDNGKGIQLKDKFHIFNKGFGKNTGLGLFLTQEILAITGISIKETGTFGEGATFTLIIPTGSFRKKS